MPTLECDHETVAGVTLVTCRLTTDATSRVTVEPTHDDPIWPPRRQGVPEQGWEDDRWIGLVPADGVRALGYATPADTDGAPARIAATEPPADDEAVTARDVIRSLGDPAPTRDAVPPAEAAIRPDPDDATPTRSDDPTGDDATGSALAASRNSGRPETSTDTTDTTDLDAIETRLWTARDLADVSTVAEASAAVERAGGIGAVRDLADQLADDRARLANVEERASRLAAEAEAVSVPVDSLERVV